MKAVNLRPLATFCLSFFLFAIITSTEHFNKLPISAALLVLSVLLFFVSHKCGRNLYLRSLAIIILALSAAFIFTAVTIDKPMREYENLAGEHTASGKICKVEWTNSYSCGYVAKIAELDGKEVDFKVSLEADDIFSRGDIFEGSITLSPLTSTENFNSRRYYLSQGAFLAADGSDIEFKGKNIGIADRLDDINEALSARFIILMGERNGGLTASMFLGNRDYLKEDFYDAVKNLGLAHVIALSGMHLTVICAMLSIFLSNISAKSSRLCAIPIVSFYIIITGFFASIVRAGIMLACYNLISFSKRAVDQPTNLGISAILIVLFDPASLYDIGFQLSVTAMLGVFATLKIMGGNLEFENNKTKTIKALLLPVVMSFISMAFTMILVIVYFGYITPAAIILTAPFAWFGDLILWMSPFVLLLGYIPFVGDILCTLCSFPCIAFDRLALLFGGSGKAVVRVEEDLHICLAILFSISFMTLFVIDPKKVRRIVFSVSMVFLSTFIVVSCFIGWKNYNSTKVSAIYEKSGEGIVAVSRDDSVAIDISNGSKSVFRSLTNQAMHLGADNIDCLVIVNPHNTHATGITQITNRIKISSVYMPDKKESYAIADLMPTDLEIVYYTPGETFTLDGYNVTTYEDTYISRSVVPIVRLKIESRDKSFFYLGASAPEANVLPEQTDILFVGSYGPKYKTAPTLDYDADIVFQLGAFQKYFQKETFPDSKEFVLYTPKFIKLAK